MAVVVRSGTLVGVDGEAVAVEVDLLRRLPAVVVVGLASAAVRESADRVRSAIARMHEPTASLCASTSRQKRRLAALYTASSASSTTAPALSSPRCSGRRSWRERKRRQRGEHPPRRA
jgi:hypothetical protein